MLDIGGVDASAASFEDQLQKLKACVENIRCRAKPKQRPVRAVVLCYPPGKDVVEDVWATALADFEKANGDLWTFGPISMGNAIGLYDVFTEMASVRIAHYQNVETGKDDDDGKEGEAERQEQVVQDFL